MLDNSRSIYSQDYKSDIGKLNYRRHAALKILANDSCTSRPDPLIKRDLSSSKLATELRAAEAFIIKPRPSVMMTPGAPSNYDALS